MICKISLLVLAAVSGFAFADSFENEGPLLSTFSGFQRNAHLNADGTYQFSFSLPQQERQEQRDADGKVTGYFAFVDKSGEEFALHFDADDEGFQPESDALPEAPEDTDDVQNAREAFFRYYEQTAKFLEALGSGEDSESSSEEDSDYEYSDEDSSSEEDSDEEDEDEEEEDEEEEEEEADNRIGANFQRISSRGFTRRPIRRNQQNLDSSVFPQHFGSFRRRA